MKKNLLSQRRLVHHRSMAKVVSVVVLCLFIFCSHFSFSQNPLVKMWDKRFGGDKTDYLTCFQQTSDGGYVLGGYSKSGTGGDKTESNWDTTGNTTDYWIVKVDPMGNKQWDKRLGGTQNDLLNSVLQTNDGGYILGGYSISAITGDKTQTVWGNWDYWVVKIDSIGNKLWDKDFGGTSPDQLYTLLETSDGSILLGGYSLSHLSGNKTQPNWNSTGNYADYWIIKISSLGVEQWQKDYGGDDNDYFWCMQQTKDGGYILGGWSWSGISGDKTQANWGGLGDYWIIKIDSLGNKQWDKDFGGSDEDRLYSIQQTTDGGYILGGSSYSNISGNKTQASWGNYDYWIIKTDSIGNKEWDKDFGGSAWDEPFSTQETLDKGYIIGGWSQSGIGGDKTENNLGSGQTWIVKTDSLGNKQWDKTLFAPGLNVSGLPILVGQECYAIANYNDGGIGGYKSEPSRGGNDYWLIKFCDSTLTTNIATPEKVIEQLLISPNPTEGKLAIGNRHNAINTIEIYNVLGEKKYEAAVSSNNQQIIINIESFLPGIYFVKAIANEKVLFGKVVKE